MICEIIAKDQKDRNMQDLVVTEEFIQDIVDVESEFCRKVRKCDPYAAAKNLASGYKDAFRNLERVLGKESLYGSRILEIGSGNGFLLCYAIRSGVDIAGVEPGKTQGFQGRYGRAEKLLRINGIHPTDRFLFDSSIEKLPFADNVFDVVFSLAVLEHVQNLELAMKESIRVLKPGGVLLANIPNYNSMYEGHYNIFWLPYMNKNMARLYVKKVFKRDPAFINELNFTTPSMFKQYLNSGSTHGRITFQGKGVPGYLFLFYNFCLQKDLIDGYPDFRGKRTIIFLLKYRWLRLFLTAFFYLLTTLLRLLGFAFVFDLILYKKEHC